MCGIIYIQRYDKKPANSMVWKRYLKQKTRGSDGFGFIEIKDKIKVKRATKEENIQELLEDSTASVILFHHRMPTSTPNLLEMTHPIEVKSELLKNNYFVIHNGIISNAETRKPIHRKMGFEYNTILQKEWKTKKNTYYEPISFNDSESLAIDLSLVLDGQKEKLETEGSIAFVALQTDKNDKPKKLFFGRNYNPLKYFNDKKVFCSLTSEGQGQEIDEAMLYSYDFLTETNEQKPIALPYSLTSYGRTIGYDWQDDDDEWDIELLARKAELQKEKQKAEIKQEWLTIEKIEQEISDIDDLLYETKIANYNRTYGY